MGLQGEDGIEDYGAAAGHWRVLSDVEKQNTHMARYICPGICAVGPLADSTDTYAICWTAGDCIKYLISAACAEKMSQQKQAMSLI